MLCRVFRKRHEQYVDGSLDEATVRTMRAHVNDCGPCGRFDVAVRRGLLVARNLPTIQPSPDFMRRLEARLAEPEIHRPSGRIIYAACAAAAALVAVAVSATVSVANVGNLALVREPPIPNAAANVVLSVSAPPTFPAALGHVTPALYMPTADSTASLLASVDPHPLVFSR
jgi:hypothetical protein